MRLVYTLLSTTLFHDTIPLSEDSSLVELPKFFSLFEEMDVFYEKNFYFI